MLQSRQSGVQERLNSVPFGRGGGLGVNGFLHDSLFPAHTPRFLLADIFGDEYRRLVQPAGKAWAGAKTFRFAGQQQKNDLGGILGKCF